MPSDRESEADEHELSSEADEHELSLDEHGRTAISGTCDYRPRVWDGVVAEAAVPGLRNTELHALISAVPDSGVRSGLEAAAVHVGVAARVDKPEFPGGGGCDRLGSGGEDG